MAKCSRCGKQGFFFKVGQNGLCKDCNRIIKLEADERKLKEELEALKAEYTATGQAYKEIREKKNELYNSIANKAKKDALEAIASQISSKNTELQAVAEKVGDNQKHLNELLEEEAKSEKKITSAANKLLKIQTVLKSLRHSVNRYSDEENPPKEILNDEALEESDDLLSTTVKLKLNLLDIRELRKRYNQNNKIIKELLVKYQGRYTTKANMSIYRLMVIALEAELQNILYNLKYSKLDKAIKDVKAMTAKYQKIVNDGNQSIAPTVTKFIGEIEYLFIEAVKIEYEYY
jgi:DNA repair exonuclease SbcCD ATPase subunit